MFTMLFFSCANIIVFIENLLILVYVFFQYSQALTLYSTRPVWSLE